ncbi:FHA domain-containing protein [Haematococcus lacustris]|uniref:FHA domain-containing protein n=1 Tax=Haematococcus lacustris TaxID=44745 RepID=A0A699ZJ80_HAELA|nr:FHA domain-containing protein [Haematococcus lacustris]
MEAALAGGATWGMGGEDAASDPEPSSAADLEALDWRRRAASGQLTEKQQKLADKIRQKEHKVKNMQTENDRISAKEKQEGGLTPGQAAALVRNEQGMNKLRDEMEELEELLLDSIKDAIADRSKEAAKKVSGKKKRATTASDEEYLGSDSDDEFYDRTAGMEGGARKRARPGAPGSQQPARAPAVVESTESLYGKSGPDDPGHCSSCSHPYSLRS